MIHILLLVLLLFPFDAWAADYHIGPGQTYTTIGAAPWSSLVAGDNVYIHAKADQAPYYEHIYISAALQGTEANPIDVIGVPDGSGNRPIIDGANSTTGPNFAPYGDPQYHSALGLLFFGPTTGDADSSPAWVTVSNLEIRNYTDVTTTDENSLTRNSYSASTIYFQGGINITLDNLIITEGTDGIFAKDGLSNVENITVKNCYIHNNGVVGDYLYHNVYTEVEGIVFEGNYFGPPLDGSPGNNIKDRSSGFVFRYNYVHNGGHLLDLVECQDECADHAADARWDDAWVYGNVLYADGDGPAYLVHHGTGDTGANGAYWRQDLYFYNNTVIVDRDQAESYYIALFQISGAEQNVYMDNNILHVLPSTGGQPVTEVVLQYDGSGSTPAAGNIYMGANWISPGWLNTRTGYTLTGTVTGSENILSPTGNDPSFVNRATGDYHLGSGSSAAGVASALPTLIASGNALGGDLTPIMEYLTQSTTTRANVDDIGAFAYGGEALPQAQSRGTVPLGDMR